MVLDLCFSCYEEASSQMEDWDRKLLVVTLHVAVSSLRKSSIGCLVRVLPRSAGVPRPVVLSCLSLKSLSFQALAGDA